MHDDPVTSAVERISPKSVIVPGTLISTELMYRIFRDLDTGWRRRTFLPARHVNDPHDGSTRVPVFVVAVDEHFWYVIKEHMVGWVDTQNTLSHDHTGIVEVNIE